MEKEEFSEEELIIGEDDGLVIGEESETEDSKYQCGTCDNCIDIRRRKELGYCQTIMILKNLWRLLFEGHTLTTTNKYLLLIFRFNKNAVVRFVEIYNFFYIINNPEQEDIAMNFETMSNTIYFLTSVEEKVSMINSAPYQEMLMKISQGDDLTETLDNLIQ